MKKCVLFVFTVFASYLFASESFVFSRNLNSNSLTYSLNQNGVRFISSVSQDRDGKFSVSAPAFLSIQTSNGLKIGELKIEKTDSEVINTIKSRVKDITSMSMQPVLSGIAKSFKNYDFAIFTPLINPLSPSGLFLSYHNAHIGADIVKTDYSNRAKTGIGQNYQINWKSLQNISDKLDCTLRLFDTFKSNKIRISSFCFCDFIFDKELGYSGSSGWAVETDGEKIRFELSDKLNTAADDIIRFSSLMMRTKGVVNLGFSYDTEIHPLPVYGGSSQGYLVEYSTFFSFKGLSFSGTHLIEIKEDSGHEESSSYELKYYRPNMRNNYFFLKGGAELNRGEKYTISKYYLRFKDRNATLEFSGKKTLLTLSCNWKIGDVGFKASVTQDRVVTFSSSIKR